jgi:Flp pilus assembly protein TadB
VDKLEWKKIGIIALCIMVVLAMIPQFVYACSANREKGKNRMNSTVVAVNQEDVNMSQSSDTTQLTTLVPTTESKTNTQQAKLPQTGTMWHLVPYFVVIGLVLLVMGCVTHRKGMLEEDDESEEDSK